MRVDRKKRAVSRTIQTMEDVLRLLDSFFNDEADRRTAPLGATSSRIRCGRR